MRIGHQPSPKKNLRLKKQPKSNKESTRWFTPCPFHPRSLEVTFSPLERVTWTHHPKKVRAWITWHILLPLVRNFWSENLGPGLCCWKASFMARSWTLELLLPASKLWFEDSPVTCRGKCPRKKVLRWEGDCFKSPSGIWRKFFHFCWSVDGVWRWWTCICKMWKMWASIIQ